MSIPKFTEEEAVALLSPEHGWASIQAIGSLMFYRQMSGRIVSAVSGPVGESEPRDFGVSLGEWVEIYLDLAGARAYDGDNPYAMEMRGKIKRELSA